VIGDHCGYVVIAVGSTEAHRSPPSSAGTFYEDVMTSGYPSSSTEAAVQANIVAAGYTT
jgi:hypothetical protein